MALREETQTWVPARTLPNYAYFSPEVFDQEKERIFFADWYCVGREEQVAEAHDYMVVDIAGESIIVSRTKNMELRGFYNTCRHRGTKLCDDGSSGKAKSGVFKCPYHAWTYTTEGNLVGTPNVHAEEGFDKSKYPLWSVAVDSWEGYVFVNLAENPRPLAEFLAEDPDEPDQYSRYGMSELRIGATLSYDVKANWKVMNENYNECLHCPSVHPELVDIVPLYRAGRVDEADDSWGVHLIDGATSLTLTGHSGLPRLPGLTEDDIHVYYGSHIFMSMSMNLTSDCVLAYFYFPRGPELTHVVTHFMFRPETIADPNFDPSPVVDYDALVYGQDIEVCERVQTGIRSRGYRDGGVYPFPDRYVSSFDEYYRERMDWVPDGPPPWMTSTP